VLQDPLCGHSQWCTEILTEVRRLWEPVCSFRLVVPPKSYRLQAGSSRVPHLEWKSFRRVIILKLFFETPRCTFCRVASWVLELLVQCESLFGCSASKYCCWIKWTWSCFQMNFQSLKYRWTDDNFFIYNSENQINQCSLLKPHFQIFELSLILAI